MTKEELPQNHKFTKAVNKWFEEEDFQKTSGRILYSDLNTLEKGDIYLLGFNPGGTPDNTKPKDQIISNVCCNYGKNAYLDEPWGTSLQKNVRWLLHELDREKGNSEKESVKKVCASNLIFKRSKKIADLGDINKKFTLANQCWQVHKFILSIVKPKLIIAFGVSTYLYLLIKLGGKDAVIENSKHPRSKLRKFSCQLNGGTYVIGLPHLSWSYNPKTDKNKIKKMAVY